MTSRRHHILLLLAFVFGLAGQSLMAAKLDPAAWKFLPADEAGNLQWPVDGKGVAGACVLTDNDLSTCLTNLQVGIDFGCTNTIDRVYVTGTKRQLQYWPDWYQTGTHPPLGKTTILVGNSWPPKNQAGSMLVPYDAGNPVDTEVDVRFSPTACRYVLIQLQTKVVWEIKTWPGHALSTQPPAPIGLNWRVAELEIHGFNGMYTNQDAVVLAEPAPAPLRLAAGELSYYLGELGGRPVPIVTPREARRYGGTLYCVDDLKRLAPDYATMMANIHSGLLPENVNIQTKGRQVIFTAWPYRCVLWSAWEFLERQGVRWLYPDAQGDFVPAGRGVDLSFLPLHYTPSATSIYANWDGSSLQPWPPWDIQSLRQGYLYPWRNHWNHTSASDGPLGGGEIPPAPAPGKLPPEFQERFEGYPHNFNAVLPDRILLAKGSNWWGYDAKLGHRVPPGAENITFCLDNPDLIQWVADKVVTVNTAWPGPSQHPLSLFHGDAAYNLLPMDSTLFCQDTQWCCPANGVVAGSGNAWGTGFRPSMSGEYYHFVNSVAQAVRARGSDALIGALAYADVYDPPAAIATFPDNVQVEVCLYGAPNLPMASPANARLKTDWAAWHARCGRLATYDYALLHTDYAQPDPQMPVPLVTAIVDRAQFLAGLGALNGGCQATPTSLPYNPWNFYAYPRIRWNINQTAATLCQEFFDGYFGESAQPMLAYYQAYENYEITNDVSLYYGGSCYGPTPGAFPLRVLDQMQGSLEQAESVATNWIVKDRVARMREGFNWVLSQRGLTGVNLADRSSCLEVPADGEMVMPLGRMSAPPILHGNFVGHVENTWHFGSAGAIQTPLAFEKGGVYEVSVTARAVPFDNVFPVLNCFLGARGASITVDTTTYKDFTFTLTVPSGAWDLLLNYKNGAPGGARQLDIKQIKIVPADH
jgi:hypothetical protein